MQYLTLQVLECTTEELMELAQDTDASTTRAQEVSILRAYLGWVLRKLYHRLEDLTAVACTGDAPLSMPRGTKEKRMRTARLSRRWRNSKSIRSLLSG